MSNREVLKSIIKFGKREFNQKKPLSLKVLRVKSKSILKRGMLPNLNIKQIQGIYFIVVLDYKASIRIYFFNNAGQMLKGENFEKSPRLMKKIEKETRLEYKLPKESHIPTKDDISRIYSIEFDKILQKMNKLFGLQQKMPLIIAKRDMKIQNTRSFGSKMDKSKNLLSIKKFVIYGFRVYIVWKNLNKKLYKALPNCWTCNKPLFVRFLSSMATMGC